mmetsp:Transcript_88/g.202  ORF Transcript_88/g.202 Transcript_88/m.202 type:complete len:205 (-) Transcript_88:306-920(-)|eukprot:CAMPEP_0113964964 /NCGR_PEP_ID=MMETSP0011_2-20120614/7472_1 /TAXON_ID=101924 /ORGANISM="Rhodosorus marinus" /LENGTH=204 /DNA_ID=CAMNT_0000977405 /DNA_START=260 /DNA_END=874 /DNA_ORIENTATION=- /assembly_acc=CAM_ASM_000156
MGSDANTVITLKGSVEIVREFFGFAVNSILFQRGIYPPETFTRVNKYGLTMLVSTDSGLLKYIDNVMNQLSSWLETGTVKKLVLVMMSMDSGKSLERWGFDVQTDSNFLNGEGKKLEGQEKSDKEIMAEIQAIIRQITASVTFLPLLNEPCIFDLLVYAKDDVEIPIEWEESDAKYITNQHEVRLRSFTTKIHKVDAMVSYAAG